MSSAADASDWQDEKHSGRAEVTDQHKDEEGTDWQEDIERHEDDEANDTSDYDEEREEEEEEEEDADLYNCLSSNRCCGFMLKNFPRTCLFSLGVVVPLLTLIFLSVFFGLILARLESQSEVDHNDLSLAAQFVAGRTRSTVTQVTQKVPRVCLEAFIDGHEPTPFDEVLVDWILQPDFQFRDNNTELLSNKSQAANYSELWDFMVECGNGSRVYAEEKFEESKKAQELVQGLTFNWIRCYDGAHDLEVDLSGDLLRKSERNPQKQEQYYRDMWNEDYTRLWDEYRASATTVSEIFEASNKALREATAGDKCYLNGSGSAWFWFTIQTTIGYGNQAPISRGGRALIFTAGFFCILAFGAVLATAGQIVLALFDDYCVRHSRYASFLAKPWWACLLWGGLWYAWMVVIAVATQGWKEARLDENMSFSDAYWFSYISTTTVGLGDYFLEPEVFVGIDLLYFPLLMLVGFTFLSAFLGKLAELLTVLLQGTKRTFVDSLLSHMKENEAKESKELADEIEKMEQSKASESGKSSFQHVVLDTGGTSKN